MGTREVYEQKLRSGNLCHDPTMNPGLGSPRCPRCLSLLNPNAENGEWAITSVLHDATSVSLGRQIVTWYLCDDSWLESNKNRKVYDDRLALELAVCSVRFMVSIQLPPLLMFSAASAAFGVPPNMVFLCSPDVSKSPILPLISRKDSDDRIDNHKNPASLLSVLLLTMYLHGFFVSGIIYR
ncbi:hypothetical protein RHMOL_Rhmol03G0004700 [Rhododendron molle]|uniref:Uncharacterized protein n=1 Tax=Rhododendron molle TaxID=49168 RepID=A0ACC0PBA8_RHOML|nr:hypothetical protein RHMOL_Rhmol03G0004700 [Rhododendron molle]